MADSGSPNHITSMVNRDRCDGDVEPVAMAEAQVTNVMARSFVTGAGSFRVVEESCFAAK